MSDILISPQEQIHEALTTARSHLLGEGDHAAHIHRRLQSILTPLLCCCLGVLLAGPLLCFGANQSDDLEAVFKTPPATARPGVWWHWMGCNVTQDGITRDLEALKAAGFGGATIFGLSDVCTPWAGQIGNSPTAGLISFTDPWWKLVRHAAAEGKRLGIDVGVHNCPGYESSGGPWITSELSMQEICSSQTPVNGPGLVNLTLPQPKVNPQANQAFPVFNPETGKVERPVVPGRQTFYRDIAMLALPAEGVAGKEQVMDLTGKTQWEAPAGKWILYRIGYTTQGTMTQPNQWEARGLECDKMSAAAVEFHMNHFLGDMKRNLGDLVGTGLQHVLFDSYEAGSPSWTPQMREEFKARRGYDMTPFLPTFKGRTVSSAAETAKFKSDFNRTIEELYRDIYFPTVQRMLRAAGLRFACEPYGGPWRVSEATPHVDRVMTEFWTGGGAFSGGVQGGILNAGNGAMHNILEAEAFTGAPEDSMWTEHPAWLKPIGDGAFLAGINRLVLHHSVHQPWDDRFRPGNTMGRWGTHFGRLQTWWEPGKAWVQYLGRCEALLQWGKPVPGGLNVESGLNVRGIHRRNDRADLFFVVNSSRASGKARCVFEIANKLPELWDPVTGTMRPLADFEEAEGETSLDLTFAPAQSYFIVFRNNPKANLIKDRANMPSLSPLTELTGDWQVSFDPKWGGPEKPVTFATLEDWTKRSEPGIKYYSGAAVYRKIFDASSSMNQDKPVQLDLGVLHHLAQVKLNGKDLGVIWCAPWSVSIPAGLLKATGNLLELEIVNVWANRLIGDEQEPADCEWQPGDMSGGSYLKRFPDWFLKNQPRPSQGRYCFTTWNYFKKESALVPSGLLGQVRLMAENWARPARIPVDKTANPIRRKTSNTSGVAFETDVVKTALVAIAVCKDEQAAHAGGAASASALFNGTTKNGSGGDETADDGKTFRGYGAGGVLNVQLKEPYDLTEIRTFAGHSDARASQNYALLAAYSNDPSKFMKITSASVNCEGGASELRVAIKASGVVAVRFEFQNGPLGFDVYREINIIGQPTRK